MSFTLPALPYAMDALQPHISRETLEFHYGKHHQTYVTNLNALIPGTEFAADSLEDIIRKSKGGIYNNAAQVWNHTFYWNCLSPKGGKTPGGKLGQAITSTFGSYEAFQEAFSTASKTLFGSGWTFLVQRTDGSLAITQESNAGCPLSKGETPILTCDVWEHAYYIDFRNARPKYLDAFWQLVNWEFAERNFR